MHDNTIKELNLRIGKKIRKIREKKMTALEFAEKMGVSGQYVNNIENGHTNLSFKQLLKIAAIIGTRFEFLICEETDPTIPKTIENRINDLKSEYIKLPHSTASIARFLIEFLGKQKAGELALLLIENIPILENYE